MHRLLTLLSLFAVAQLFGQVKISNNCKADLALIQAEYNVNRTVSESLKKDYPIHQINGVDYLSVLAKTGPAFNSAELETTGVRITSRIGNIISLKYPLAALSTITEMSGITTLQVAGKVRPDLHKVVFDTRVDSIHAGLGLPGSFTGKDIIIGVTDWGFDYSHPMFYDTLLENTRIMAAWDQFKTSGPAPDGYDYGTEYNTPETLIAAGTDTANIYSYGTHGTHVAGIAGGSDAGATIFRGIAFESEFLFTTFLIDEGAVLDAWQWMYDKAEAAEKRLVINMSWGLYHTGALDGTSLLSQALDNYSDMGVVFVTSAGNNGNVDFHIAKTFENDTLLTRVDFYSGGLASLWGQSIHAWGEVGENFSAGFHVLDGSGNIVAETPWYATEVTDTYVDSYVIPEGTTDTIWYNLAMDEMYPTNDRPQMRLRVKKPSSIYRVILNATSDAGKVHFWNVTELVTEVGNWGMPFTSIGEDYTAGDNTYGIGAPACTETAVTVAAYAASYLTGTGVLLGGARASFSSIGPMMNDSLKPDISAPGANVASSASSYSDDSFTVITTVDFEGRTYPFARFSGTSMSSPAVAGIAALILQANPYLSPWQVKTIIIETAREDEHTGVIPPTGSTMWGWGKINAYAAVVRALNTTGVNEIAAQPNWQIYPNPATTQLTITNLDESVQQLRIFDLNGKVCGTYVPVGTQQQLEITHLAAGTYVLHVVRNNKVEQRKFVVQ